MTERTFRPFDPDQVLVLPPSLRDWLPADHLAYFVADLVAQLFRLLSHTIRQGLIASLQLSFGGVQTRGHIVDRLGQALQRVSCVDRETMGQVSILNRFEALLKRLNRLHEPLAHVFAKEGEYAYQHNPDAGDLKKKIM